MSTEQIKAAIVEAEHRYQEYLDLGKMAAASYWCEILLDLREQLG